MLSFLRLASDHGFTLAEVLVAMSLFSTAVLGLAVGATTVMRANQTSYFQTIAANLAQDQLEVLKAMTVAALPTTCTVLPTIDAANCSNTYTPPTLGVAFARQWQVLTVGGVIQINVQVTWADYRDQNLTISSSK